MFYCRIPEVMSREEDESQQGKTDPSRSLIRGFAKLTKFQRKPDYFGRVWCQLETNVDGGWVGGVISIMFLFGICLASNAKPLSSVTWISRHQIGVTITLYPTFIAFLYPGLFR